MNGWEALGGYFPGNPALSFTDTLELKEHAMISIGLVDDGLWSTFDVNHKIRTSSKDPLVKFHKHHSFINTL